MDYPKSLKLDGHVDWQKLENLVKESLKADKSGHDYLHALRVIKNALNIGREIKKVDYNLLIASCLLHDISYKTGWVKDHHLISAQQATKYLMQINFPPEKIKKVQIIIEDHVGMVVEPVRKNSELSIESRILRDADNIDALGAIGLARQISFCSAKSIPYFISKDDRFNDSTYGGIKSIITWADKMLTPQGKKIAKQRITIMKEFLKQMEREYL